MKIERFIGYSVVITAFTVALTVLIPWDKATWDQAVTTRVFEFQHPQRSKTEAMDLIIARMDYINRHFRDLDIKTVHANLIIVNEIMEYGPHDEEVQQAVRDLARMNMNAHERQENFKQRSTELYSLQENDPAWRSMRDNTDRTWYWNVLCEYAGQKAPFSLVFMIIGFLGLMKLWGLAKFVYVAGCTLSFLLSVTGGAIAQTVKKVASGKKEKVSQTLQVDARISLYTSEGPPTPGLFLRVTNSRSKILFENVSAFNPKTKAWSSDIIAGFWIPKTGKIKVLASGLYTDASKTAARIGAGIQIFRSGKIGTLAIPVLRWERKVHGPPEHSFVVGLNPNMKIGSTRWSVAPDVGARRTQSKPWSWYAGIGLRFTPDKGKHQFEGAPLTNSAGIYQTRLRFIKTMAY